MTEAVAADVLRNVYAHVQPDPYTSNQPGHSYEIASLYLDDCYDSLYRETIEGASQRYKLRVRSYGGDHPSEGPRMVFLEVKRRFNRIVQKLRCPVPHELLDGLLYGQNVIRDEALMALPEWQRPALHEFLCLSTSRGAGPRCIVRYQRQAYVGRNDLDTRVTFDRELSVMSTDKARVQHEDPCYIRVPVDGVILELKFTDQSPPWMSQSIRTLELQRRSFSKYCKSIDTTRLIAPRHDVTRSEGESHA